MNEARLSGNGRAVMGDPRSRPISEEQRKRGRPSLTRASAGDGCACYGKINKIMPQLEPARRTAKELRARSVSSGRPSSAQRAVGKFNLARLQPLAIFF